MCWYNTDILDKKVQCQLRGYQLTKTLLQMTHLSIYVLTYIIKQILNLFSNKGNIKSINYLVHRLSFPLQVPICPTFPVHNSL